MAGVRRARARRGRRGTPGPRGTPAPPTPGPWTSGLRKQERESPFARAGSHCLLLRGFPSTSRLAFLEGTAAPENPKRGRWGPRLLLPRGTRPPDVPRPAAWSRRLFSALELDVCHCCCLIMTQEVTNTAHAVRAACLILILKSHGRHIVTE